MNVRWIIPLPLAIAGFAAGYLAPSEPVGSPGPQTSPETASRRADQIHTTRAAELSSAPEERSVMLAAGLRSAMSQYSKAARTHALAEFFKGVTAEEITVIADLVMELPNGARWWAMQALVERWLELDPQAAARYVEGARGDRENLQSTFASAWALHDPEAALRWAGQLPRGRRLDVQRSIALALAFAYRGNPEQGVAVLLKAGLLSADRFRGGDVFEAWAKRDPRAALACAFTIDNQKLRRGLMDNALKGWGEIDPAAAAAWCRQISDPKLRNEAAAAVAIGMAVTDFNRSLGLARSLPEGRTRDRTLALMAEALLWNKREQALQVLAEIPFEAGNQALTQVYNNWATSDAGAVVADLCERLNEVPSGSEERKAVETFLERSQDGFSRFAPAPVVKALAAGLVDGGDESRGRTLDKAAEKWAAQNLGEARAWSEALPEGVARESALAGVARGWANGSISEVVTWLDALPASRSRDAAVGGFARTLLARDPAVAMAWMRTIPDSERRLATLEIAWAEWMKRSPAEAAQWRDDSPDLTAVERRRLAVPQ